jgi:uncharacterized protein YcfL
MTAKRWTALVASCLLGVSALQGAHAADEPSGTAKSKVALRGKDEGVKVAEMRVVKNNDILVVQADFENTNGRDRVMFYRFRWVDANGNQVGDGEAFKQLPFLAKQKKTIKGVAPTSKVTDFQIEMNVERK